MLAARLATVAAQRVVGIASANPERGVIVLVIATAIAQVHQAGGQQQSQQKRAASGHSLRTVRHLPATGQIQ